MSIRIPASEWGCHPAGRASEQTGVRGAIGKVSRCCRIALVFCALTQPTWLHLLRPAPRR